MTDERDPLLDRAIDALRAMPAVERAAIDRVVRAAASARISPADEDVRLAARPPRRARMWRLGGVAAAAVLIGAVLWRGTMRDRGRDAPNPAVTIGMRPVAATAEALPIARQFVFNARTAHSVALVGDFNGWNPKSAPMSRSSDGNLWSVTVPILPGRHTFGYMVDDSVFALDPRMPKARDPDLGTEGSVVIVGRP